MFRLVERWSRGPARPLISASRATGRLFISIFSGLFLFFGLVAASFTMPIEISVTVFNFLHRHWHWQPHLHSLKNFSAFFVAAEFCEHLDLLKIQGWT
jgi:hypothetical protein